MLSPLIELVNVNECDVGQRQSSCVTDLSGKLSEFANGLGFGFYRFGFRKYGDLIDALASPGFYLSNFPGEWDQRYLSQGHYLYDPVIRFTRDHTSKEYISYGHWSDLLEKALAEPVRVGDISLDDYRRLAAQVYEEAKSYGIHSGIFMQVVYPTHILDVTMATPQEGVRDIDWQRMRTGLLVAGDITLSMQHCARCKSVNTNLCEIEVPELSDEELEVLRQFDRNSSATHREIGLIIKRSSATVDYHLRKIRLKFGTPGMSGYALSQLAKNSHEYRI